MSLIQDTEQWWEIVTEQDVQYLMVSQEWRWIYFCYWFV